MRTKSSCLILALLLVSTGLGVVSPPCAIVSGDAPDLPPEPFFTSPSNDEYLSTTLMGVVKIHEEMTMVSVIDLTGEDDVIQVAFDFSFDGLEWFPIGVDVDPGFEGVQFNGGGGVSSTNGLGIIGWNVEWETGWLMEGFYLIRATMMDGGGLVGEAELMVHYDPTPPLVTMVQSEFCPTIQGNHTFVVETPGDDIVEFYMEVMNGSRSALNEEGLGDADQFGVGTTNTQGTPQTDDDVNNFCGPTAAANALWRLAGLDPRVGQNPSGGSYNNATEMAEELAGDMGTNNDNGTSTDGMTKGLKKFLDDHNLTGSYGVDTYVPKVLPDGRIIGKPWWSQYWNELRRKEAVIVLKVKPGPDGTVGTADDEGHYETGKDADHVTKEVSLSDPKGPSEKTGKVKAIPKNNGFESIWFDENGDGKDDDREVWYLVAMWAVSPRDRATWNLIVENPQPWGFICADPDPTDGLQAVWDTTTMHDGFYLVKATLIDGKGNVGANYSTVYINNDEPAAVTLSQPGEGDVSQESVGLEWTMNIDEDFLAYEVYQSGGGGGLGALISSIDDWTSTSHTVDGLEPGTPYHFTVRTVDASGGYADSNQVGVETAAPDEPTDEVPPEVHIISPEAAVYSTDSIPLEYVIDEPTAWVGYSLDGGPDIPVSGEATLSGLADGEHTMVIHAEDEEGNLGSSPEVVFNIDTTPPTIHGVTQTPEVDVMEGDTVTVNVDVSDGNTGVEEVILSYTDGVAWHNASMIHSEALGVYTGEIGEREAGASISYKILARDEVGNWAVDDNSGALYGYEVTEVEEEPPEPSGGSKIMLSPLLLAMAAASVIVVAALVMFLRRMRTL